MNYFHQVIVYCKLLSPQQNFFFQPLGMSQVFWISFTFHLHEIIKFVSHVLVKDCDYNYIYFLAQQDRTLINTMPDFFYPQSFIKHAKTRFSFLILIMQFKIFKDRRLYILKKCSIIPTHGQLQNIPDDGYTTDRSELKCE